MTDSAAAALAAELGASPAAKARGVAVSIGITSWTDGAMRIYVTGPTGSHSLDAAASTEARVRAHFAGFLAPSRY
jgi:hypothetical protein